MAADPVDLLIVGGGIVGAATAREAALRGIRTAVVDQGDFAGATSSGSSRLIHGGLRYLEHGDWRLVLEASRERAVLLRIAPHLVHPLAFVFPIYRGSRVPAWQLRAGLWVYDALASFRNTRMHRWLGPKAVSRVEPRLRTKGLAGAGFYYDAQTDDARLALGTLRSAAAAGALVANYASVTNLLKSDGMLRGATVEDVLTGTTWSVHARVVVNATGPWVDRLRQQDDPSVTPLLRATKGVHVAVPRARLGHENAITFISPIDGRVMFVLPWGDMSYIGTTDTDDPVPPEGVRASGDDVVYLLRSANAVFPDARLAPRDVFATWAGLRPLLSPDRAVTPAAVSREHRIVTAPSGLITVAGGKLTTHRVMGRDVVDQVSSVLHAQDGRPETRPAPTERLPLPGGEAADLEVLVQATIAREIPEPVARHLVGRYGAEAAAVANLVERDRKLGDLILPNRPDIWAEIVHAVERELAVRLSDVLIRRLHLFYEDLGRGLAAAPAVAALMGELLGWDKARRETELALYSAAVERTRAFLTEVPRLSRAG